MTVKSSRHGTFTLGTLWGNHEIDEIQQRRLYIKQLDLDKPKDILALVKDDIITVTVDGESYRFLNPELEF